MELDSVFYTQDLDNSSKDYLWINGADSSPSSQEEKGNAMRLLAKLASATRRPIVNNGILLKTSWNYAYFQIECAETDAAGRMSFVEAIFNVHAGRNEANARACELTNFFSESKKSISKKQKEQIEKELKILQSKCHHDVNGILSRITRWIRDFLNRMLTRV